MTTLPGFLRHRNFFAAALLAAALLPHVSKAQTHCFQGNGTLVGLYVSHATGTLVGVGPISAVNLVQFNGDGTGVVISETGSINGNVIRLSGLPVTYTVNRDCTGSMTTGSGATASTFDFVVSPDGNTTQWIATDPGEVCTGEQVRVWH